MDITIIGAGNVASHLIRAFLNVSEVNVVQVFARNPKALYGIIDSEKVISNWKDLKKTSIYIIAVSDKSIAAVGAQIPFEDALVVHTSGTMSFSVFPNSFKRGVFYPLQTFSSTKDIDFSNIPICIETEKESDYLVLERLAKLLSEKVYSISESQRKALHLAAVFVCNFTNHLYAIGNEICTSNQIPFDLLLPLIQETADKVKYIAPKKAQTGPAIRHDDNVINHHLSQLNDEAYQHIYQLITQSIQSHE